MVSYYFVLSFLRLFMKLDSFLMLSTCISFFSVYLCLLPFYFIFSFFNPFIFTRVLVFFYYLMNSSYLKDANHFSIIFIGISFFFSIFSLPFHFVYNYLDYLVFLSDIIENSSFECRNEAAERNIDESSV